MQRSSPAAIAVIGLACRYPDATTPRQLWENILARRRQFRRIPDCRLPLADYYDADKKSPDKTYARQAAVIDGFDFDWAARRIPFSTVRTTDIVHWLALETSLAAVAVAFCPSGSACCRPGPGNGCRTDPLALPDPEGSLYRRLPTGGRGHLGRRAFQYDCRSHLQSS